MILEIIGNIFFLTEGIICEKPISHHQVRERKLKLLAKSMHIIDLILLIQ